MQELKLSYRLPPPYMLHVLVVLLQALQFLVFDSKGALSLEDLTEHVCPALNHQQLYRLCTTAWSEEAPGDASGEPQGKMHGGTACKRRDADRSLSGTMHTRPASEGM